MLRYFFISLFLAVVAVLAIAGFRGEKSPKAPIVIFPDMDDQPRYNAQAPSNFYADGRAARKAPEGTVPHSYTLPGQFLATKADNARRLEGPATFSNEDNYLETGRFGDVWGDGIPVEVTPALLARGKERYGIHCAACHGPVGNGNGIVSKFGLGGIANLLDGRIRQMPDGNIFDTITHGKGNMGAFGPNISVEDRWAIITYIRALQLSQNAKLEDVAADQRGVLEKQ